MCLFFTHEWVSEWMYTVPVLRGAWQGEVMRKGHEEESCIEYLLSIRSVVRHGRMCVGLPGPDHWGRESCNSLMSNLVFFPTMIFCLMGILMEILQVLLLFRVEFLVYWENVVQTSLKNNFPAGALGWRVRASGDTHFASRFDDLTRRLWKSHSAHIRVAVLWLSCAFHDWCCCSCCYYCCCCSSRNVFS